MKRKSPFTDFVQQEIFEGDVIETYFGSLGIVVYDDTKKIEKLRWLVDFNGVRESLAKTIGYGEMSIKRGDLGENSGS